MLPDLDAIGLRAVACSRWRWMPGMAWYVRRAPPLEDVNGRVERGRPLYPDALPDLTDPATAGCLLALVREAYGEPGIGFEYDAVLDLWGVYAPNKGVWGTRQRGSAKTEAGALVAALEAAP